MGNAEDIISQIALKQEHITALEDDISIIRKQLKELTIPQLSPLAILGE